MRAILFAAALAMAAAGAGQGIEPAGRVETQAGPAEVTRIADGFEVPWALDFLPGGGLVVTERGGRLWRVDPDGTRHEIEGLPDIAAWGQGGLLDVMLPRDFAESREVFFTYSTRMGLLRRQSGTAVAAARLAEGADRLTDLRVLFRMTPGSMEGQHYGSRIVEATDGTLFFTIGDRGDRPEAQNLSNHIGTVLRIERDGSVPADNPFLDEPGAQPEIWSYGHRNPQGMALDLDGNLWAHEHGARGGDEINRIEAGENYGWPVISYGTHYSGAPIGEGTEKPGMMQPEFYWDPSIAPSGMVFYSGALWPEWRGHIFAGSLNSDFIARVGGEPLRELERISGPQTGRIRDVAEGPDGALWFLSETDGAVYRMTPAPGG
ncbi:MAG: PQQ-dependent sugar dehydrogenase [Rhodosalinus sp.]